MSKDKALGPVIHSFFADHLITVKGLRPASVRSYRDTIRPLLTFTAADKGLQDYPPHPRRPDLRPSSEVPAPPRARPRQRRPHLQPAAAVLHTLSENIAVRSPETLAACQQVTAIPMKRSAPAETGSWNATRSRTW